MFTGLIENVGSVISLRGTEGKLLTVESGFPEHEIRQGESIAVNGACLTVITREGSKLGFDVSPETLRSTALGELSTGSLVNLERSLKLGDRLGGHLVTGHIDGVGSLVRMASEGNATLMIFTFPSRLGRYLVPKGSIAVDGISLTVNSCGDREFSVSIIPHTWDQTNLRARKIDDKVNLEADLIGKYVERLVSARESANSSHRDES
jgi:riboflavin synthase